MNEEQKRKLQSIFCNGVEFKELESEEIISLAGLYMDAIAKQVPKKLIPLETSLGYVRAYKCPVCEGGILGSISSYCYHCGQKLSK